VWTLVGQAHSHIAGEFGRFSAIGPAAKQGSLLAQLPTGDALYAIDRIPIADEDATAVELDHVRRAATIHHANVVQIVEVGTNDEGGYVVTEHVRGVSLAAILAREPELRPRLVLPVVIDALYGLHAAHAEGVIHGKICPENLFVGVDGVSRITGFHHSPIDDRVIFSAPEQVADTGVVVDHRTDVFSLAVVLWNVLTGTHLYARDRAATLAEVFARSVPPPSTVGFHPPAIFDPIMQKALARDRDQRFASAEDMAHALRASALKTSCLGTASEVGEWAARLLDADRATQSEPAATRGAVEPSRAKSISMQRSVLETAAPPMPSRRLAIVAGAAALVVSAILGWRLVSRAETPPAIARGVEVTVVDVRTVTPLAQPAAVKPMPVESPPPVEAPKVEAPKIVHAVQPPATRRPRTRPVAVTKIPEEPHADPPATKPTTAPSTPPPLESNPYVYK
jgi:serine/threonine-protein kinase